MVPIRVHMYWLFWRHYLCISTVYTVESTPQGVRAHPQDGDICAPLGATDGDHKYITTPWSERPNRVPERVYIAVQPRSARARGIYKELRMQYLPPREGPPGLDGHGCLGPPERV